MITHGFGAGVDDWVTAMANAIAVRPDLTIDQSVYRIDVTDPGHDGGPLEVVNMSRSGPSPTDQTTQNPEITLLLDWSDVAGQVAFGGGYHRSTFDVAAAVATQLVTPNFLSELAMPVAELPFHLLGHSRGASLVGELAHALGLRGVWVDQVTTWDPHPVDGINEPFLFNFDFDDAPMVSYENVAFWDNYWRTQGGSSLDFTGEPVANTANYQLSESVLSNGGYDNEHSDVHLWYHGTVDFSEIPPANDGFEDVPSAWYGGPHPNRDTSGFFFSRMVGGTRPVDGLLQVLGGDAVRTAIDWSAAIWPNVLELHVDDARRAFSVGETVPVSYYHQDADSPATVTFSFDVDRSPYNANEILADQQMVGQTTTLSLNEIRLPTNSLAVGSYYILAKIADAGGRVRYAYAAEPIVLQGYRQFIVNSLGDDDDANPGDGLAEDATGKTTLRAAIEEANALGNLLGGPDRILFDIDFAGPDTIAPLTALPTITDTVVIDGTSEPDYDPGSGNLVVEIDGMYAGNGTSGLIVAVGGTGSTIRGLAINNFDSAAIRLSAGSGGNTVTGNVLGLDVDGSTAAGNLFGLHVSSANNTIEENVISGNNHGILLNGGGASGNTVRANLIGINAGGNASLGNNTDGVKVRGGSDNIIGGPSAADGNTISANFSGVSVFGGSANNNTIQHNLIGTKSTGDANRGNFVGINLIGTPGTTIQDNVVAGSKRQAIRVTKPDTTGTLIENNLIGLDVTGTVAIANKYDGIQVSNSPGNTIRGNVIANSGFNGIRLLNALTTGNSVQGNLIGTALDGTTSMANLLAGILIKNASGNQIGGAEPGQGNTISANGEHGILIERAGAIDNVVAGNRIGTNAAGTAALGNASHGIQVDDGAGNIIGGAAAGAGNVIAGNLGAGIAVTGGSATIQGNFVGTDASGTFDLGNTNDGINVNGGVATIGGEAPGAGNTIANNGNNGVKINSGMDNAIRGNSIHDNTALGIDLKPNGVTSNDPGDTDTGANNLQNFPILTSAVSSGGNTTINGTLNSITSSTFTVEFFSSPTADPSGFGEGEVFLGSTVVNTDISGNGNYSPTFAVAVTVGHVISATATDAIGNTSEFSTAVVVSGGAPLLASGGEASPASSDESGELGNDELAPIVDAVIARLDALGFDAELLSTVKVTIADLPGAALGLETGNSIIIDIDAADHGWYVDATPLDDAEFSGHAGIESQQSIALARRHIDLLTTVMHELGHTAGFPDLYDAADAEDDLMFAWLEAGIRKTSLEASLADLSFADL